MKYVKLEHEVNLEAIGNIRNEEKKDSVSAIKSSLLTIAEADTEFCNFNPFRWMGLSNR